MKTFVLLLVICLAVVSGVSIVDPANPNITGKRLESESLAMDERVKAESKEIGEDVEVSENSTVDLEIPYGYVDVTKTKPKMTWYDETMDMFEDQGEGKTSIDVSVKERRSPVYLRGCVVPRDDFGKIKCRFNSRGTSCVQNCPRGYSVLGHRKIRLYCRGGQWNRQFRPCMPSTDCRLRLKSSGNFFCTTNSHGKRCTISCKKTKHHPAIHDFETECMENGVWHPKLPHCVRPVHRRKDC